MKRVWLSVLIIGCAWLGISVPISAQGQSHIHIVAMSILLLLTCLIMVWAVNKFTKDGKLPIRIQKLSILQISLIILLGLVYLFIYISASLEDTIAIFHLPIFAIIACVVTAIEAGVVEEYLVRGYIFQLLFAYFKQSSYRLFYSALLSSLLFGCLHLINLHHGQSLNATLQQVFYATCIGMFFALIRITFNRIYVSALLHIMFDMQSTITNDATESSWIPILIVFGTLFILASALVISYDRKHIVLE